MRHTGLTTMYFTLSQRRLRWLGHTLRIGNERIPKSMLYRELVDDGRKRGLSTLRFKDVCERLNVGTDKWKQLANYCDK